MTGAAGCTRRRERPTSRPPWPEPSGTGGPELFPERSEAAERAAEAADRELAEELLATLRLRVWTARAHASLRARQGDEARRRGAAQAEALLAESHACAVQACALARELAALERTWAARAQGRSR